MTRRAFALSLTRSGALTFTARAALRAAENPRDRAATVIGKTIFALGGDAFRNMQTRTEIGRAYSFYREQLSGLSIARLYTKYPAADAKFGEWQRQVFGKKEDDAVILTGPEGWEMTFRGAKPLTPERLSQFRETTLHDIFYILRRRMNEPGLEFESRGADVVENQPVEAIDIFDAENRKVSVWISSSTWLPVKQSTFRPDPVLKERIEEATRFTKYRDAGNGVMWPYAIERSRDGEKIFQMYSEKVTVGTPLDDSLFRLPPGAKMWSK